MRSRSVGTHLCSKMATVCSMLKPSQSLEFVPRIGMVTIISEFLIPADDLAQITDILAEHSPEEKIVVHRFPDTYRVVIANRISCVNLIQGLNDN